MMPKDIEGVRMCRLYKSKKGDYIRCCAATGHQGLRLPVNEAVFGKSGHVLFGNKNNPNSHKPKPYHGCIICGGLLLMKRFAHYVRRENE